MKSPSAFWHKDPNLHFFTFRRLISWCHQQNKLHLLEPTFSKSIFYYKQSDGYNPYSEGTHF
jgi:hypothetical protein